MKTSDLLFLLDIDQIDYEHLSPEQRARVDAARRAEDAALDAWLEEQIAQSMEEA